MLTITEEKFTFINIRRLSINERYLYKIAESVTSKSDTISSRIEQE